MKQLDNNQVKIILDLKNSQHIQHFINLNFQTNYQV